MKLVLNRAFNIFLVLVFLLNYSNIIAQNNTKNYLDNNFDSCSIHICLGIPIDDDQSDDYILCKTEYVISYNQNFNSANWAAWNLNSTWIGSTDRYKGKFITDNTLPEDFEHITHNDYTNTGYDRGHIVRSYDRSSNDEANKSTFLMTNIFAQTPDLNRGVWLDFERFIENLAKKQNKELYIFAGGIYNSNNTINEKIRIPDSCYKIAVVLNRGEGLECVEYNTMIYAVMIPNINGIRRDKWQKYAVSVSHIENSSGYNFLTNVPEEIQGIIEQIIYK